MNIGLTFDLRTDYIAHGYTLEETAEFDKESTIAGLEQAIQNAGHKTERIGNARSLMEKLLKGVKWDMVFNIAEGLYGAGRESLVPALLDSFRIPYVFSGPVTLGVALNKAFAKQIVRASGVNTPAFFVVSQLSDIEKINLEYPLFVKPVSEGTGKGIDPASLIKSPAELKKVCARLLSEFNQPVLVEEYLPGREFTVGVLGTGEEAYVPGAIEIVTKQSGEKIYTYENKENYADAVEYTAIKGEIFEECKQAALQAWKALDCLDGGRIDVKTDRHGKISFIEVNPLAGLNPISSDLPILCRLNAIPYQELIAAILKSAIKRHFKV
ncbi:ATP-grasp domain-containing protein [bacterium]|nr:ATP-grasp domain-containing protein [bacterium]MBU3929673.1 ATP-grasp domain-containing protein [bacterium]MBU4122630.1 ATP-grasp domain-containing protein [bacterium]